MREILFRGKGIDTNEWVYGGYGLYPHTRFPAKPTIYEMKENTCWWPVEVIPKTVGQYTGLKDKNGQRIFEGDIVHIWVDQDDDEPIKKYRAIVEFGNPNHEYNWGYQLKMIDTMSYNEDILLWVEMEEGGAFCEVIGNIHDKPELMKEEIE